tara:strand:+ start:2329 stop:2472 length:144 start_codon:yes stop_codon:yes gene_type:complete
MKIKKTYVFWILSVALWNFGFPNASPFHDVLVAIVLSFFFQFSKDNK